MQINCAWFGFVDSFMNSSTISLAKDRCKPFSISSITSTPPDSNMSNKYGNAVNSLTVPNDSSAKNVMGVLVVSFPSLKTAWTVSTPTVIFFAIISLFSKSSLSIFWCAISSSSKETLISLKVGSAFCKILIYFANRSSEKASLEFVGFNLAAVILTTQIPLIAALIFSAILLFNNAAIGRHNASSFTTCFVFSKSFKSDFNIISL